MTDVEATVMTAAELERAARELCKIRGIDPDASILAKRTIGFPISSTAHGAEAGPDGFDPAIMLYSPAWKFAAKEIKAHVEIEEALSIHAIRERRRNAE